VACQVRRGDRQYSLGKCRQYAAVSSPQLHSLAATKHGVHHQTVLHLYLHTKTHLYICNPTCLTAVQVSVQTLGAWQDTAGPKLHELFTWLAAADSHTTPHLLPSGHTVMPHVWRCQCCRCDCAAAVAVHCCCRCCCSACRCCCSLYFCTCLLLHYGCQQGASTSAVCEGNAVADTGQWPCTVSTTG
jgi:hypothetical protein